MATRWKGAAALGSAEVRKTPQREPPPTLSPPHRSVMFTARKFAAETVTVKLTPSQSNSTEPPETSERPTSFTRGPEAGMVLNTGAAEARAQHRASSSAQRMV